MLVCSSTRAAIFHACLPRTQRPWKEGGATSAQVKMSSSVMVDVRRPVEVPSVMQRCHTATGGAALATTVKGRLVQPQLV